jgi:hypothetical protein
MQKNKYDLASDIAKMLAIIEDEDLIACEKCIVKDACRKKYEDEERMLCTNVAELTQVIEKKYLR